MKCPVPTHARYVAGQKVTAKKDRACEGVVKGCCPHSAGVTYYVRFEGDTASQKVEHERLLPALMNDGVACR